MNRADTTTPLPHEPLPPHHLIALFTLVRKEIRRFARIWVQTVVPPVITTALYFVIFGELIGSRIGPIAGHDYMEFIVPGLILMAIITNAYANVVSSFFASKFQRFIEELLVAPFPNVLIVVGYMCGGIARGLAVGVVVALVALLFSDIQIHSWPVTIAVALLTAALFALGGFINGIFAKSFDDIAIIPTFVLAPLTYLGGIFYSVEMLPPFWQQVSLLNPILYMINAFRYGLLGSSDIDITLAFAIISAFLVALFLLSLLLLQRGVGIRH